MLKSGFVIKIKKNNSNASTKKNKISKIPKKKSSGLKVQQLNFGIYGIQSLSCGRLSASCIEAARRAMTRKLKRTGQIWIRVFPDLGVSKKPAEVEWGKGKVKLTIGCVQ